MPQSTIGPLDQVGIFGNANWKLINGKKENRQPGQPVERPGKCQLVLKVPTVLDSPIRLRY